MPIGTDTRPDTAVRPRPRRAALTVATLAAVGLVLLGLFVATEAVLAADGTLTEPFRALALGTLAVTAAGVVGLALLLRGIRRRGACGRGSC